ncbi:MAG: hypothetical protein IH874_02920 [Candidatus Dadabacteria bacterium]|nr:hypothetical protein [Candidatus Dadabacteria bacterium]
MSSSTLLEIRRFGEKVTDSLSNETVNSASGLETKSDFTTLYRPHRELLEPDTYASLRDLAPAEEEERTSKSLLLSFLAKSILGSETSTLEDARTGLETSGTIKYGKRKTTPREYRVLLKQVAGRAKRLELIQNAEGALRGINENAVKMLDRLHSISSALGYDSYLSLFNEVDGLEIDSLKTQAEAFLKETEYVYRDLLVWFLDKKLGINIKDAKWHDLSYMINSHELSGYFKTGELSAVVKKLLRDLGVLEIERIKFDLEPHPAKARLTPALPLPATGAAVFALHPVGSVEDYELFLHETGAALFLVFADPEDFFEFRWLREPTASECFGYLFERFLLEPKWLKRCLKLDADRDLLTLLYFRALAKVRNTAGRLLYSLALHEDGDFTTKTELFIQILDSATMCEHDTLHYLLDEEPFLHTASILRGAALALPTFALLTERFDEEWWRVPQAGQYLTNIWEAGGRTTSETLAREAGVEKPDLSTLVEMFQKALG